MENKRLCSSDSVLADLNCPGFVGRFNSPSRCLFPFPLRAHPEKCETVSEKMRVKTEMERQSDPIRSKRAPKETVGHALKLLEMI